MAATTTDAARLWSATAALVAAPSSSTRQEITPSKPVEEDCRVCDACSRVTDEMLTFCVSRRFGEGVAAAVVSTAPRSGVLVNREATWRRRPEATLG
ncbi:uncharacterized protein IUM83_12826 [Phytophthora cinnamomi]|uniref:uncharacterized protein n=1 Tax=Phytophthora cinnamomi TaxID=4785 RepID=UPI00355A1C35|nr:hypothetical protein IUM83_12826 [Phytophthora cinnamomi]